MPEHKKPKKKFCITHWIKIRDVVEADDPELAMMVFRAKYPASIDKEATLINIQVVKEN